MKAFSHLFSIIFIPLLISILHFQAVALNVNIRIYSSDLVKSLIVAPKSGTYLVEADGKVIDTSFASNAYSISIADNMIEIKTLTKNFGKFSSIRFRGTATINQFNIKPVSTTNTRVYDDDLLIGKTDSVKPGYLKIINCASLEHYLAGVVEWEAGPKGTLEFFKVQAIICRTWALNNIGRHQAENYELCDVTHCQVYRSATSVPLILQAVEATKGIVLVDAQGKLINAAFHSNCGGYTQNCEEVWSLPLKYLRAVKDTFCTSQLHATWIRKIAVNDWKNYLEKSETGLIKATPEQLKADSAVPQQSKLNYEDDGYLVPLKTMRYYLNLQSTWFTVEENNGVVTLKGRGNGHRVGLCQEGAMHMAQTGYTYRQILNYYYKGVQLVDASVLQEEGTR